MTTLVTEQRLEAPRPVMAAPARHAETRHPVPDIVDTWGQASFPASDPPANW